MKRIVIAAVLLLGAASLAGALAPGEASAVATATPKGDTVSVNGTGTASGTPDTAQISAGVETTGSTAKAALAANAARMSRVIAALRAAGGKNVTTQVVGLSPRTDQQGKPNGFVATNSVSASIALERAGALIDAAVDAGANTVYGPSLTNSGARALYRQALRAAVADAREHAEALATAAGRKVGRVVSLVESGASTPIAYAKAGAAADASTPVVAGEQDISASVSVTFELR